MFDRDAGKKIRMPERLSDNAGIWYGKLKEVTEEHGITPARKGKDGKMQGGARECPVPFSSIVSEGFYRIQS